MKQVRHPWYLQRNIVRTLSSLSCLYWPRSVPRVSFHPNHHMFIASHHLGHAIMSWFLKHTNNLSKVSIIPRGKGALGFAAVEQTDKFLMSDEEVIAHKLQPFLAYLSFLRLHINLSNCITQSLAVKRGHVFFLANIAFLNWSHDDWIQMEERMCVFLGGRVSEEIFFGSVTTGAQNDLSQVTRLAYAKIRAFGMNARVGLLSFPSVSGTFCCFW